MVLPSASITQSQHVASLASRGAGRLVAPSAPAEARVCLLEKMAIAPPHRDRPCSFRASLAAGAASIVFSALVGCADLLDLPTDPQLAEESTPVTGRGEPALSGGAGAPAAAPPGDPSNRDSTETITTPGGREGGAVPPSGSGSSGGRDGLGSERADAGSLVPDAAAAPLPPREPCAAGGSLGPDNRCYVTVSTPLSWQDAQQNCRDLGGGWDLATIHDEAVNAFISERVSTEAWVGASDLDTEGTWVWVDDGVPFWSGSGTTGRALNGAYVSWNSDEPNGAGNSDCARLVPLRAAAAVRTWADLECFELIGSVCAGP
jgi:hypothetical protein